MLLFELCGWLLYILVVLFLNNKVYEVGFWWIHLVLVLVFNSIYSISIVCLGKWTMISFYGTGRPCEIVNCVRLTFPSRFRQSIISSYFSWIIGWGDAIDLIWLWILYIFCLYLIKVWRIFLWGVLLRHIIHIRLLSKLKCHINKNEGIYIMT